MSSEKVGYLKKDLNEMRTAKRVYWTLDDLAEIVRLSARLVYTSSPSERDATVAEIRHLLSSRLNVTNGRVADFELML